MSADVARGHGGDCGGGGDPPRWNSNRIPTSCETSKQKNKRGPSKGKNLEAVWKANGNRPLPVLFDKSFEGTYYGLGDNGTKMNTLLGSLVRTLVPPYYLSWDEVPVEVKAPIIPRVETFFDIGRNTHDWERINVGLDRYCARRYADNKWKLHDYFKKQGGRNNVARARRNPPSRLTLETWNQLIDVFLNQKWQDRSNKNSDNRKKQRFSSFHGTRSYINTRFKKMNPETKQIQGAIENWHDNHFKENRGWANEQARLAYEQLVVEKQIQSQHATSSSANGFVVNEGAIFSKVFGDRRGHNIGLGRKLKRPSGLPCSSNTSTPSSYETMKQMIQGAQEASDRHHE